MFEQFLEDLKFNIGEGKIDKIINQLLGNSN